MKSYLLIIFGEFKDSSVGQELALCLTPLVDSPQLKFQISKGSCIFHFATEVLMSEIHEFVQSVLANDDLPFILTELNDKVSVHMNKTTYEHLMDLKTNEGSELKLNSYGNKSQDSKDMVFESEDENLASLLNLIDNSAKPSLDSILDKITEKGFDSLTEYEKEVLDEYSNK